MSLQVAQTPRATRTQALMDLGLFALSGALFVVLVVALFQLGAAQPGQSGWYPQDAQARAILTWTIAALTLADLAAAAVIFSRMSAQGRELVSQNIFALCAGIVVVAVAAILIFVGSQAFQTFTQYKVGASSFFLGTTFNPDEALVGILPSAVGSLTVTVLGVLIGAPISVGLAIFITQIAPTWARRFMQPVLELFAGIPSIIYGFLALQLIVPLLAKIYNTIAGGFFYAGYGVIAAGIILGIMILPTITSISVDALGGLPSGMREASLALGATRWQTVRQTLLPAASSGIFTGIILGMGRAIGETLAVAYVIGGADGTFPLQISNQFPYLILKPTTAITVQLLFHFKEAVNPSLTYSSLWTLAFILLLISLALVIASRAIAARGALAATQRPAGRGVLGMFVRSA